MLVRLICLSLVFGFAAPLAAAQDALPSRLALAEEVRERFEAAEWIDRSNRRAGWRQLVLFHWQGLREEDGFARYFEIDADQVIEEFQAAWRSRSGDDYAVAVAVLLGFLAEVQALSVGGEPEEAARLFAAFRGLPESAEILAVLGADNTVESMETALAWEAGDPATFRRLIDDMESGGRAQQADIMMEELILAAAIRGDLAWAREQALNRLPPDLEAAGRDREAEERLRPLLAILASDDDPIMRAYAERFLDGVEDTARRRAIFEQFADVAAGMNRIPAARRYALLALLAWLDDPSGMSQSPFATTHSLTMTLARAGECESALHFDHLTWLDRTIEVLETRLEEQPVQTYEIDGEVFRFGGVVDLPLVDSEQVWVKCAVTGPLIAAAVARYEAMYADPDSNSARGPNPGSAGAMRDMDAEARNRVLRGVAARVDWRKVISEPSDQSLTIRLVARRNIDDIFFLVEALRAANRHQEADEALSRLLAASLHEELDLSDTDPMLRPYILSQVTRSALEVRARAVPLLRE